MARIGLKVFYLRTREREVSQQAMADTLGVRQATLSNIERGTVQPSVPLLTELCRYFNVSPSYLIDDERDIVPRPTDRWHVRNALVTAGMWVECPKKDVVDLGNGNVLCPMLPGEAFYDEEAKEKRLSKKRNAVQSLQQDRAKEERALARALAGELRAHPQRRKRS